MNSPELISFLYPWGLITLLPIAFLWWVWHVTGRASEVDWGGPGVNRIDGLNRILCKKYHRLHGDSLHLPESGPAIVVANHVSGLDPLLLVAATQRRLRFIIASEEYHRYGFNWLFRAAGCIPVDRKGRPERAFRAALKALDEGEVVAIFPHGGIHLDSDPYRKLKPGAVRLAQLAGCPVYPARIEGVSVEGRILMPVMVRSKARIENYPAIDCSGREPADCLSDIEKVLVKDLEEDNV
jgi:1-acyl-sn-glycerol-3-phosphate acyltransferase